MAPLHPRNQSLTIRFRDEDTGIEFVPNLNALYWELSIKEKLIYDF